MPNELSEIEVDEVSLVDRPATGKRFVLFKRGSLLRRGAAPGKNICSDGGRIQELEKRATEAEQALAEVREVSAQLEQRLAAIETGCAPRQSSDTPPAERRSLWAGIL